MRVRSREGRGERYRNSLRKGGWRRNTGRSGYRGIEGEGFGRDNDQSASAAAAVTDGRRMQWILCVSICLPIGPPVFFMSIAV